MGETADVDIGGEQLEDRADVDLGRLEQDIAERAAEPLVVERDPLERLAGERVAVRVQTGARQPDHRVAGRDRISGDDRVEGDDPDRAAGQLEAGDDVADLGDLAARDLDPGDLGTAPEALPDRAAQLRVGGRAEDEVDQGDRLGADADQIVDVHRDAVDPDRLEPPEPFGDDHLRADPVGPEGDPGRRVDAEDARVVAGERHDPRGLAGVDPPEVGDERRHRRVGAALADPGLGVGVLAHRRG